MAQDLSMYDMTPEQFKAVRKSLRITQHRLAEIFEAGERSIKRYESKDGEVPRMAAMAILLLKQEKSLSSHKSED
jgi:DNA-binding transcriptional regulator YiaG